MIYLSEAAVGWGPQLRRWMSANPGADPTGAAHSAVARLATQFFGSIDMHGDAVTVYHSPAAVAARLSPLAMQGSCRAGCRSCCLGPWSGQQPGHPRWSSRKLACLPAPSLTCARLLVAAAPAARPR